MKKKTITPLEPIEEGLHIVTSQTSVDARVSVGREDRITSKVLDGSTLIAEFTGATAPNRAQECLELAKSQKARGVPIVPTGKCIADGARIKIKVQGPMLPWG